MTEAEWLASDDPALLLDRARSNVWPGPVPAGWRGISDRKLRLWVEHLRLLIELRAPRQTWHWAKIENDSVLAAAVRETWAPGDSFRDIVPLAERAVILRDIVGNPFRPVVLPNNPDCSACRGSGTFTVGSGEDAERMRCRCCPWLTPAVVSLAHAAYDHRDEQTGHLDPFRLAMVADALEEAGCESETKQPVLMAQSCLQCGQRTRQAGEGYRPEARYCELCARIWVAGEHYQWPAPHPILAHLRGPGPHVRGCHVIDLLAGRE